MDGIVRARTIAFTPDRMPMLRRIRLGYEGDNLVERLEFDLPEITAGQTATLMITGADAVTLERTDEGRYAVDLTRDMIGPDGEREAYVRIDGASEKVWQSAPMRLITGALPDVEEEIEKQYPTAVGQMLTAMAEHSGEMQAQEERVEQAAQRAEEAAKRAEAGGGGGGSGAPGKDGGYYQPSVTDGVLSWTPSKADMPSVPASDVRGPAGQDGQPGKDGKDGAPGKTAYQYARDGWYTGTEAEFAAKMAQEIPEPYTLPVATADRLGGMMIGEGLNVDEAGRVSVKIGGHSGLNGKIELIEEINLTEDTSSIVRNLLPDGTPYNFKSVLAMIGFYQDISNKWIKFAARYTDYIYTANPYAVSKITEYAHHKTISVSGNKHQALHTGVVELDGVIMGIATLPHLNPSYHNAASMTIASKVAYNVQNAAINEVVIESEIPLVAGTTIFLFGVKRDD